MSTESQFNFTYGYMDYEFPFNNPDFETIVGQMKDTTESNTSALYLDLLLSIWRDGQLNTLRHT